jgi:hypothetical protein
MVQMSVEMSRNVNKRVNLQNLHALKLKFENSRCQVDVKNLSKISIKSNNVLKRTKMRQIHALKCRFGHVKCRGAVGGFEVKRVKLTGA